MSATPRIRTVQELASDAIAGRRAPRSPPFVLVDVRPAGPPEAPEELVAITVRVHGQARREAFRSGRKPRELAQALELAAAWLRGLEESF